ncbi:MAG: serine/threonine-protein kinase, partial [Dehalococcoidia bacterium]
MLYYPPTMLSERVQRRIDRLLDQAEEAADREDWAGLADYARAVLVADSENADAKTFLAMAEEMGAGGEEASNAFSDAVSEEPPVATAVEALPTSFAGGRYEVRRFLGEGGKKRVFLAHDTLLDREVAFALIKTQGFDDVGRQRITREAQAMGRLGTHPNIVTVFDLGQEPSTGSGQASSPYMVTELMRGGDVEALVEDAEDHRLPLERAIEIGKQVCDGLQFAHAQGVVHRDLKPGNVWLTEDPSTGSGQAPTAKIGDFGLAVIIEDRTRLTREGMMVGTVSYMPPEQATGGDVTPRSDLYSLGAMLYE